MEEKISLSLDAPAAPSLTLDPLGDAAAAEKEAEQPKVEPVTVEDTPLTPEEQKMVDDFAEKIDITNSQIVLQYGAASQKKISDFSEAALDKVRTKDMGEVGDMLTSLVTELQNFDALEEQPKGFLGLFKRAGNQLEEMKTRYNKVETNVDRIEGMLEAHQVQLMKDIAMLDKMYQLNMTYFKELSMYILAGKKKLKSVRRRTSWRPPRPRPAPAACRRTPRRPGIWPTCATGLRKSCTIWN